MSPPKNKKANASEKHDSAPVESFLGGSDEASWEIYFAELVRFHEQYGHVRVPYPYPPSHELPLWLAAQKTRLADLSRMQIRRLWELGVKFPGRENHRRWFFRFFKLVEGWEHYGDANDVRIWREDPQFQVWIETQRTLRNRLIPVRRRLLAEIGFILNPLDVAWEKRFEELLAFKARFGHSLVTEGWSENPGLGLWLANQRRRCMGDPQKKKRLEEAGVFMNRDDMIWENHFQQWCDYVRKFGNTKFPRTTYLALAKWAAWQRIDRKNGTMNAERIRRLDETGFSWKPSSEQWDRYFRKLERFRQIHGHCRVGTVERSDPKLIKWCWNQPWYRKQGRMPAERIARLDALGFTWDVCQSLFEEKLERLKQFHAVHGHSRVPEKENPQLVGWIRQMRQQRKKGRLSPEQIQQIDGLIEWDPLEASFEKWLKMLKRFHAKHGHSRVPKKDDPKLAGWLRQMRFNYKRGRLSAEHIRKLDGLIHWNPEEGLFEERLKMLKQFHAKHGHGRVMDSDDLKLAGWLRQMRFKRRRGQLSSEHIRKLDGLIDWNPLGK